MVNTVGSLRKLKNLDEEDFWRFWQNKWKKFKRNLHLTERQISVLVGSMLGDGTLRVGKGAVNANFKIEHGLKQKEYVFWKYKIFKKWVTTKPKISYRYRKNGERYKKSWWFRTVRHPEITYFRKLFYRKKRKIIPNEIKDLLNPLALAVWVMDDGSRSGKQIDLSTYRFTWREIKKLQKILEDKFQLKANFYRDRDKGYRMYFNVKNTEKLVKIISPYILPSLRYKLP
jgi:ubiquinol-cytochrome c reductase cytochrome b subunit